MRPKWILVGIGLIVLIGLAGCNRVKGTVGFDRKDKVQTLVTSVPDQQIFSTQTPQKAVVENTRIISQKVTATPEGWTAPNTAVLITLPASNVDLKQTVNDLSNSLDNLTKDLNSTDTMTDVK